MTDEPTVELVAVTEEELQARARRRRSALVCTDPSYVVYLEKQLGLATEATESARSVFVAVGAHNAELTAEVERLRGEVLRLTNVLLDTLSGR